MYYNILEVVSLFGVTVDVSAISYFSNFVGGNTNLKTKPNKSTLKQSGVEIARQIDYNRAGWLIGDTLARFILN